MKERFDSGGKKVPAILSLAALVLVTGQAQGMSPEGRSSSGDDPAGKASLIVHAAQKAPYNVPRFITGKFCEHLYFNVTNGMDAQILKNPTFSDYPFSTGQMSPDGVATFHYGKEEIGRAIRGNAEYCNGDAQTPMGKLRAASGNPKPHNVKHWEIGNELWGDWQYHWTTAEGYVDRYRQFVKAVLAADPTIRVYACGAPVLWGKQWNDTLIAGAADLLRSTTDHPLIGGQVPADADPLDVFRDFMAVPEVLEQKWAALREAMTKGGVADPHLAVTELQMFARVGRSSSSEAARRPTREILVNPATQAEALYNILIYHVAVRLAPFVEIVTHSATVNHGGGLHKSRERVFANPCHYAQSMFANFAETTPVKADLTCATVPAPLVLPDLRGAVKSWTGKIVDVLAAQATDGALLLSVVHKGTERPLDLKIDLKDFPPAQTARIQTLSANVPWATNTLEAPTAIAPVVSARRLDGTNLSLTLPPYSYTVVRIPRTDQR